MAIPLVSRISSPGRIRSGTANCPGSASPSIWPTTIGRSSPRVISVWPPQRVISKSLQAREICSKIALHHFRVRPALGQKQGSQKPAGRSAHRRDVIGIDLHRIPADLRRGEGDGIGFGDQIPVAEGNDRGVPPDSRFDDKAGIFLLCGKAGRRDLPWEVCREDKSSRASAFSFSYYAGPRRKRAPRNPQGLAFRRIADNARFLQLRFFQWYRGQRDL